ncbi:MAG: hypothetical protein COT25_02865, partial [Candidatus Kerfeldbacteria bacterium CG08_land_8_20_14_0_20_42_7]
MIKIKSIVYLIVALLLFVLTFIYLKIDLVTVLKLISDVNILLLCGGLIIFSFTFPVYSFRSYILIKTIKKNISYVTISVITYINMAVNYLTPFKLGIPSKLYFLKKIYSISYTDGGIISVIEILIEVLALALFSVFWSLIFGQSGYILPLILLCIFLSIFILGILFFKIPNIIKKIISKISNKFAKIEYTLENSNKIAFRCLVPSILLTLLILII